MYSIVNLRDDGYLRAQISLIVCAFAIFASHSSFTGSDVSGVAVKAL